MPLEVAACKIKTGAISKSTDEILSLGLQLYTGTILTYSMAACLLSEADMARRNVE